jgi:hypothetical protein
MGTTSIPSNNPINTKMGIVIGKVTKIIKAITI